MFWFLQKLADSIAIKMPSVQNWGIVDKILQINFNKFTNGSQDKMLDSNHFNKFNKNHSWFPRYNVGIFQLMQNKYKNLRWFSRHNVGHCLRLPCSRPQTSSSTGWLVDHRCHCYRHYLYQHHHHLHQHCHHCHHQYYFQ